MMRKIKSNLNPMALNASLQQGPDTQIKMAEFFDAFDKSVQDNSQVKLIVFFMQQDPYIVDLKAFELGLFPKRLMNAIRLKKGERVIQQFGPRAENGVFQFCVFPEMEMKLFKAARKYLQFVDISHVKPISLPITITIKYRED